MAVIEEAVIKLTSEIDNQGIENIFRALDTSRLKALGFTAAIAGLTTAVYKFVQNAATAELELAKMAKTQGKTVEAARASERALSAMGKTLREVQGDKELNKTYQELVKINKEMALPNMAGAIDNIKSLRTAFWELKDTANYVVDWIGARVLTQLEEPIKRITGNLKGIAGWLRMNLNSVSMKISSYITAFAKGVLGVVEGFGKVVDMVNQLDPGIRKLGTAILFVMGLIKTGPIGQILALVTAIGGAIDDLENFKYNQANGLKPGDEGYVETAGTSLWEQVLDPEGKIDFAKIAERAMTGLTDGLNNFWNTETAKGLIGNIFNGAGGEGGLIGAVTSWIRNNEEGLSGLGSAIVDFFANAITAVGGPAGGFFGQLIDQLLGEGTVAGSASEGGKAGASLLSSLGGAVAKILERLKDKDKSHDFWSLVKEGLKGFGLGAVIGSLFESFEQDENGNYVMNWEQMPQHLATLGKTLVNAVINSVTGVAGLGGEALKGIFSAIFGADMAQEMQLDDGTSTTLMGTLTGTITGFINGLAKNGNFIDGIKSGLTHGLFGTILGAIIPEIGKDDQGNYDLNSIDWEGVFGNLAGLGATLSSVFSKGIEAYHGFAKDIFSGIGQALKAPTDDDKSSLLGAIGGLFRTIGETDALSSIISEGLAAGLGTGNFWVGLVTSMGSLLHKAIFEEGGMDTILKEFDMLWNGYDIEDTGLAGREKTHVNGIRENVEKLFAQVEEAFAPGSKGAEMWESVQKTVRKTLFGDENKSMLDWMVDGVMGAYDEHGNRKGGLVEAIGNFFTDIWEGFRDQEGNRTGFSLKKWLLGDDSDEELGGIAGAIKSALTDIAGQLTTWLAPLAETFNAWIDGLLGDFYNKHIKGTLWENVIADPGKSTLSDNQDGTSTITGSSGKSIQLDSHKAKILEPYLDYLGVTDDGKLKLTGKYEGVGKTQSGYGITINDMLSKYVTGEKFGGVPFFGWGSKEVTDEMLQDRLTNFAGIQLPVDADTDAANAKVDEVRANVEKGGKFPVELVMPKGGGGGVPALQMEQAFGGRIGHEMNNLTVGEDGTEYIIPITKPSRAAALIKQMFGEMGTSAVSQIIGDMGIGLGGNTIGEDFASIASAVGGGSSVTTNNNVSAPVNIYVTASGVGAEDVGERAYDAAQRHMLRTLRGVFA